jgi:hypothetical protein
VQTTFDRFTFVTLPIRDCEFNVIRDAVNRTHRATILATQCAVCE